MAIVCAGGGTEKRLIDGQPDMGLFRWHGAAASFPFDLKPSYALPRDRLDEFNMSDNWHERAYATISILIKMK